MPVTAVRRRALTAAVAAAALLVGGAAVGVPALASADTTVVEFTGDAGDALTQGVPRSVAPPAATIDATGTTSSIHVSVVGTETWDFVLEPPAGEELTSGTTYPIAKAGDQTGLDAGFDLSGEGRSCTAFDGTFTLDELTTDAETGAVTALAASFVAHCNGSIASARGVVYVHSSLSYAATSSLTIGGTATQYAGGTVDLGGTLTGPGGPIAGVTISLSRKDGAVVTPLTPAVTQADGTWAATLPFGLNDATYTASYAGDADHADAQQQHVVALKAPETSAITLTGPDHTFVSTSVLLTGNLSGPGGPIPAADILLTRTDASGTTNLPTAKTGSDGNYSATVAVGSSDATFKASFAGDAQRATVVATWVVTAVAPATSTLTITGPASALATSSVDLGGVLSGSSGVVEGATISLSRTDAAGTTALTTAVTGADGSWTATVPLGLTDGTFTASFAGDSGHVAVQASRKVDATRYDSAITVVLPTSTGRGVAYAVTGVVTGHSGPLGDQLVTLRRTDLAGTRDVSVRTDVNGAYTYTDTPAVGGPVSWRASWAGNATHSASSASRSLTVSRLRTTLTAKVSATVFAYGRTAYVSVHLGTTYNRRDVYVYARPLAWGFGGTKLIGHATVNSAGNALVPYTMRTQTQFIVRFSGDYRYDDAVVTVNSPLVKAAVSVALTGWYHKVGVIHLFHAVSPRQVITVMPYRPGRCFSTTVQAYQNRKWSTVAHLTCGRLDYTSHGYATLNSNRPLGIVFRIAASVGNDTASRSLAASSPWVYLQFT